MARQRFIAILSTALALAAGGCRQPPAAQTIPHTWRQIELAELENKIRGVGSPTPSTSYGWWSTASPTPVPRAPTSSSPT